ncbi:hypothetical protein LWI28_004399 [Acer negundo]|uniref:Uncharacterized protein n=1 Tax=Acer negundo TaxID=4023 RepID=A0AAD5P5A8_ACENE|nr:hypothetical protein LWI28_004399 [Acer negundo]
MSNKELLHLSGSGFFLHMMSTTGPTIPKSEISTKLKDLLTKFNHVFKKPSRLPPIRSHDHQIPLLLHQPPVSTRPYSWGGELHEDGVIRSIPAHFGIPVSNSSVTVLHDHKVARVNTLFSLSERNQNYRVLLDLEFLCRFGLSSSQGEMSWPKRKTPADAQRELVRLAYEKKKLLTPLGQITPFGQPTSFGQPTPFGSFSSSFSLKGAQDISAPFPREPRVCNDVPSGYLQRYSQRIMGMTGVEEDSLIAGSVEEVVASFDKMHLQHQLRERDTKLMDRDNSIRVLELDRKLMEKTISELRSEKAQLEARNDCLKQNMEKRERVMKRENKRNANKYLKGYMDAQT